VQDGRPFGRFTAGLFRGDRRTRPADAGSRQAVRVNYEPGLFDGNRFGVALSNGMLAAVNTQPDSEAPKLPIPGVQTLASTINPGFALVGNSQEAFVMPAEGRPNPPACNDGPVVIGYRRLVIPLRKGEAA
jgi:hypothetical protein